MSRNNEYDTINYNEYSHRTIIPGSGFEYVYNKDGFSNMFWRQCANLMRCSLVSVVETKNSRDINLKFKSGNPICIRQYWNEGEPLSFYCPRTIVIYKDKDYLIGEIKMKPDNPNRFAANVLARLREFNII